MQPKPHPSQHRAASKRAYTGNGFTLSLLDGWQDKTIYTLTGPVENGIQHHVIINIEPEVTLDKVVDQAE